MAITSADLVPGRQFAVPNQGTAITADWLVVTVLGVYGDEVHYQHRDDTSFARRTTPLARFLEIINDPPHGPHHTPRPELH
jgi:hypothetical protein